MTNISLGDILDQTWLYALISACVVSSVALVGSFALSLKLESLKKFLIFIVSFSAGALLGGAFIHLIPEAIETVGSMSPAISVFILSGILGFFILEKIIHWHHCHNPNCAHNPHPMGTMNLIGNTIHHIIDGLVIGAAYIVSIPVGISITLAVIIHEIPQKIGEFGVLVHSGHAKRKALIMSFFTSLTIILG